MKNKIIITGIVFLTGLLAGWLFFHSPENSQEKDHNEIGAENNTIWTCSMHPQIRMHAPGKCPICGMDLIPVLTTGGNQIDPDEVHLSKSSAKLADIETVKISKQKSTSEIHLYGKILPDERLIQSQTAHISGRIEELDINFTGEPVKKGQRLALIYSPELITAQQELFEAVASKQSQPMVYEAAREKLLQLKLTKEQVNDIEKSDTIRSRIEVLSNSTGFVASKKVNKGDYVSRGTVMFEITDLSKVWVSFEAYENDLEFIKRGDKIIFTLKSLAGSSFSGSVEYIDPVIDPVTRVALVRTDVGNQSGLLKPGMFASGVLFSSPSKYGNNLVIPKSSVLWTGKRSVVYVKQPGTDEPVFRMREIELGPLFGDNYVVTNGLSEGEEVVTNGAFSVDAAAQLEGKQSMMNRK